MNNVCLHYTYYLSGLLVLRTGKINKKDKIGEIQNRAAVNFGSKQLSSLILFPFPKFFFSVLGLIFVKYSKKIQSGFCFHL